MCHIPRMNEPVLGIIDNLVKGAAGQAVQSANALSGRPETAGQIAGQLS